VGDAPKPATTPGKPGTGRAKQWAKVSSLAGILLASAITSLTARLDACDAERTAEAARAKASQGANSAAVATKTNDIELTAAYRTLVKRLESLETSISDTARHAEYLEKRAERLETLLFQVFSGNRAVRDYEPPAAPAKRETVFRDKLPESPEKALQQQIMDDPVGLLK
jgi:hypothetical protein